MLNSLWYDYKVFSLDEASKYISLLIESDLRQQVMQNDCATLVLTGGNSIVNFLSALQKIKLPWSKVTLVLSDDRLVSSEDPRSNENLIKEKFLNDPKIKDRIIYISIKESFLYKWEDQYYEIVKSLKQAVIILSMGQDGHVASLFTANDLLGEICLKYIPRTDFKRITLSYKAILSAFKIYIIVYGNKKIDFLKKININNFYLKDLFSLAEIIFVKD